jgi:hypothetical protein
VRKRCKTSLMNIVSTRIECVFTNSRRRCHDTGFPLTVLCVTTTFIDPWTTPVIAEERVLPKAIAVWSSFGMRMSGEARDTMSI